MFSSLVIGTFTLPIKISFLIVMALDQDKEGAV